jgi:hypothetical protein
MSGRARFEISIPPVKINFPAGSIGRAAGRIQAGPCPPFVNSLRSCGLRESSAQNLDVKELIDQTPESKGVVAEPVRLAAPAPL